MYNTTIAIDTTFALRLINVIKKNQSLEIKLWTKNQVNLFIVLIKCYVKAVRVEKSSHKIALKTNNRS